MKSLQQISVIGMGLLGASFTLTIKRSISSVKTIGYSHRSVTRSKARDLGVADEIVDDIAKCVSGSDLVILATPISAFEETFIKINKSLKPGCIVTDLGSVKVLPHRWARKHLSADVCYVGSHPIAGSEKRGAEFARDDLFANAQCILTRTKNTNASALKTLKKLWSDIGCEVSTLTPAEHDRIFAKVSHVPHVTAVALVNANDPKVLKYAGKGFVDTSRLASGPQNIWTDILLANSDNTARGIKKVIEELYRLQKAIENKNQKQIEKILTNARQKRKDLIKYKLDKKQLQ